MKGDKPMARRTLTCGLIAGRHDMPVDVYIFDEITDVLDFSYIREVVWSFVLRNCDIDIGTGSGINQADYTDISILYGKVKLIVYVTGLTAVTAELIRTCALYGVDLTLMHYNRETGDYVPQDLSFY